MEQPKNERDKVGKDVEINDRTRVPMFVMIACITAFVSGALWINNSLNRIDNRLATMEQRVNDRWSGTDMRIWIMQLKMDNPNLKVPAASTGRE